MIVIYCRKDQQADVTVTGHGHFFFFFGLEIYKLVRLEIYEHMVRNIYNRDVFQQ